LVDESLVLAATDRLNSFAGSTASPDQVVEPARIAVAERSRQVEELAELEKAHHVAERARDETVQLRAALAVAQNAKSNADNGLATIVEDGQPEVSSDALTQQARDLAALVSLGRKLGLYDGHCPLCDSDLTEADFEKGLATTERLARELSELAVEQMARQQAREAGEAAVATAQRDVDLQQRLLLASQDTVREFERRLTAAGLGPDTLIDELVDRRQILAAQLARAQHDLRIVETLRLNALLIRARRAEADAKEAQSRAERKLGLARRAETHAQALHAAARRAANEAADRRLERVLPLIAELYRRLRPHPVWEDIDYKIRGDVRRFLRLQVGDELNPQFLFSSGQRRATGLAFLLSVNLSLAWSRWRSILLDDPVQHIDDFRSVQLAEVMAQLSASGRQIICAVEDNALADLLCRRLPIGSEGQAKRVTLGSDHEGALTKLRDENLLPLPQHALVSAPQRLAG
jgi:hypothetical protein